MKRAFILFSCLAALYSCSDELEGGQKSAATQMTINATFEDQSSSTRTSLGSGNTVVWDEGDALSVFDFNTPPTNSQFSLSSGAGTTSGTFTGTGVQSSTGYFAVYPYSSGYEFTYDADHPKGDVTVKNMDITTQYARKGSIPSNIPMVAYAASGDENASVNLSFKNVFAYLKLTIGYKCKSVTVAPNATGESLTPMAFHVAIDGDGIPYMHDISFYQDKNHDVKLVNQDGSDLQPGTYYVAVYPQTLEDGFKMTFTSSFDAEKTITKKAQKSVTLKRSTILNLGTIDITELASLNGSGTAEDPYQISDWCDLCLVSTRIDNNITGYSTAYYTQTKDIDCEGQTFVPIGTSEVDFAGTYDGNNHSISNVALGNTSDGTRIVHALFAFIRKATIKNLTIQNPSMGAYADDKVIVVSPLVGIAQSGTVESGETNYITNCNVTGNRKLTLTRNKIDTYYGGIVAHNSSELQIVGCINNLDVEVNATNETAIWNSHYNYVGGIIGLTEGTKAGDAVTYVNKCRNNGDIKINVSRGNADESGTYFGCGGIVGCAHDENLTDVCCRIYNCVNSGDLYSYKESYTSSGTGGIMGYMNSDGYKNYPPIIDNCLNKGVVTNYFAGHAAGIVGLSCTSTMFTISYLYCVNTRECAGAIAYVDGSTSIPTFSNCFTTVTATDNNDYCTLKSDLTAAYMNGLISSTDELIKWRTNADGTLDLDF